MGNMRKKMSRGNLHLEVSLCCPISRCAVSSRSALGSQAGCRVTLLMCFSPLPFPTMSPGRSACQQHRTHEGKVAPGPVSSCLQGLNRAECCEKKKKVRYLCVGGAGTRCDAIPFGIAQFSFTAVLSVAYKHSTFKLSLPSDFPVYFWPSSIMVSAIQIISLYSPRYFFMARVFLKNQFPIE